ncbi:MAG: DUF2007 domain-containing protein [Chthonomonadales bacterium]
MSELVVVATFSSRAEAELAHSQLEMDGIHSIVSVDDAGGALPYLLTGGGGAKIMVNESDLELAKQSLGEE